MPTGPRSVGTMADDEHPYVRLARTAIRRFLETGRIIVVDDEHTNAPARGVFVSLHERLGGDEALRGCVGSIRPREDTLGREIARSAVAAAVGDPRFPPLRPEELDRLDITVYILGEPEPVASLDQLDPARYGVIVEGPDGRTGLLLPAIPGVDDAATQVDIARRKALLEPDDPVRLYRFGAEIVH